MRSGSIAVSGSIARGSNRASIDCGSLPLPPASALLLPSVSLPLSVSVYVHVTSAERLHRRTEWKATGRDGTGRTDGIGSDRLIRSQHNRCAVRLPVCLPEATLGALLYTQPDERFSENERTSERERERATAARAKANGVSPRPDSSAN